VSAPLSIGITCFPTYGGSGVVATEIGLSLAARGHQVHFICSALPSRLSALPPNVVFHPVVAPHYPLFDSPYALALASKMVEVTQRTRLDLLHVHYAIPHATSAFLAGQILGPARPKVVTTLHGTDITLVGMDASFAPITRFSIAQSDGVTVPSQSLRTQTYEALGVPRSVAIEVIPNFVDTALFRPPSRAPAGVPLLVHTSNFRAVKRVGDVLRIFAAVRQRLPCELALVGDGPDRGPVEALARELGVHAHVRFLGERRDLAELLQGASVFLLPSELESFGLAALEAQSCGVPVVASSVGGIPEVIQHGATGFLHPVGDVAAMAQSVVRLLEDSSLHRAMSRQARAQVEQKWPRETLVSRYENYYRQVLR